MNAHTFKQLSIVIVMSVIANIAFANDQISIQIHLDEGWNLISVPFDTQSPRIFEAASTIVTFANGAYAVVDKLKAGKGYWVKAPESATVSLTGIPGSNIQIDLSETWQIIGSPCLSETSIAKPDDVRITMFAFIDGSYQLVDRFEPGRGYWMKAKKAVSYHYSGNDLTMNARLKRSSNPGSAEQIFKQNAMDFMERILDKNLENALNTQCRGYNWYDYPVFTFGWNTAVPLSIPDTPQSDPDNGATEYSETNNQVAGVDEADFIKNDGKHIYMLTGDQLKIIQAWPPKDASVIASVTIEGTPKKLFVHNNRAVVYSSMAPLTQYSGYVNSECTYGYNCEFTGDGHKLKITILDISQIDSPQLVRELYFDGSYINARRIDNAVHSVILFPEMPIPGLEYEVDSSYCDSTMVCDDYYIYDDFSIDYDDYYGSIFYPRCYWTYERRYSDEELIEKFEALKQQNKQVIQNLDISDFGFSVRDVQYIDDKIVETLKPISELKDIYFSSQTDGMNCLSIFSFDIQDISSKHAVTMMGKPGAVYASRSACYIASTHREYYRNNRPWFILPFWGAVDEVTTIHKFTLSSESIQSDYVGSGAVKGRVLNQFAMDEHNGFLRIATTVGYSPSPRSHNILSIVKDSSDGNLEIISKIDHIAPTEDIRSVRFNGDKGFIVTFRETDPLFAFDLSDPYSPVQTGELHIPGFSTYIHLMDDNHLLSIGYDQGTWSLFQGIALQIFDISDMQNPKRIHKEVIGSRGSSSEAATNHLAFNFFAPKNLLAIPMTVCERNVESYGYTATFSGLMVYKTTTEQGFEYLGGVSQGVVDNCYNQWANSESHVKRAIFMEDYVYSVALDEIKVNAVSTLGEDIAVIELW